MLHMLVHWFTGTLDGKEPLTKSVSHVRTAMIIQNVYHGKGMMMSKFSHPSATRVDRVKTPVRWTMVV